MMTAREWFKEYNKSATSDLVIDAVIAYGEYLKNQMVGYWTVDDFYTYHTQVHSDDQHLFVVTKEEAEQCFMTLAHEFDANVGISWDTIKEIIIRYKQTDEQEVQE